jgi:two-component system response regulator AtoC
MSETRAKASGRLVTRELPPDDVIFGCSEAMSDVRRLATKVAAADIPILIQGEGGSGKELIARWIHSRSSYRSGEFVKINCAAIPGTLFESELFGYEQGAFTGALSSKPGRVELAHDGTLFLDEIAGLEMGIQGKVLHFLQDGCFSRIGGNFERAVNTRLICSTQKDLGDEVDAKLFRADLFYRINVVRLRLPPLRERPQDIPIMVEHFRAYHARQFGKECESIHATIVQRLKDAPWPGNIRELSNLVARYVLIGPEALTASEVSMRSSPISMDEAKVAPLKRVIKDVILKTERNVIMETLRANHWNRRKTAQALKISYRALIYKIRAAGLTTDPLLPGAQGEKL